MKHCPLLFSLGARSLKRVAFCRFAPVQVKMGKKMEFKPLETAINEPGEFLMSDLGKFEKPAQLHVAFQVLILFTLFLCKKG